MDAETLPKAAPPRLSGRPRGTGAGGTWCFDRFQLDLQRGVLASGGKPIALRPKTFALLCYLVENAGRLISKDELLDKVWADVVVTEDSVIQCIGELRATLGDRAQRVVKTVPRRGYMLDVRVQRMLPAGDPMAASLAAPTAGVAPPPMHRRAGVALSGLALVALLLGGALTAAWWWRAAPEGVDKAIVAQRAIAVLPFVDLSEPAAPALAEAVVEDLNLAISRLPQTLVIASGSTASFGGPQADAQRAGRALRASYVITGSVHRQGDAVLIRVQQHRTDNGAVLWGERFEYQGTAHWSWQRDVAERVANALNVQVHEAHKPPPAYGGRRPDAIEATQQGLYLMRHVKTRDDVLRARALFERAVAADPDSAVALTGVGQTYIAEVVRRWSTERERHIALAAQHFDRAIELRPDYPMAHFGRSFVLYMRGQIDEAALACEQMLALWPNNTYALQRLGFYRLQQGRPAEVAAPVELSLRLNPLELSWVSWGRFTLGMGLFHQRRDDEAYEEMRKAASADPSNGFSWQWMAAIDALHGRDEAASTNLANFRKLIPGHTVSSLKATEPSKYPAFWAERERFYDGLLKAGLPP